MLFSRMPARVRLFVLVWTGLLSFPNALIPSPPFMHCRRVSSRITEGAKKGHAAAAIISDEGNAPYENSLRAVGEGLAQPPASSFLQQYHYYSTRIEWAVDCQQQQHAPRANETGSAFGQMRAAFLQVCMCLRHGRNMLPWIIPILGGVQGCVAHLPAVFFTQVCTDVRGQHHYHRKKQLNIGAVYLLERMVHLFAIHAFLLMLLWMVTRLEVYLLWITAAHCALQFTWDTSSIIRALMPEDRLKWNRAWLNLNLTLFACIETPLLLYASGAMFLPSLITASKSGAGAATTGTRVAADAIAAAHISSASPSSATTAWILYSVAHLLGWVVSELCSDLVFSEKLNYKIA